MAKIIALAIQKGGSAKTTTAANVAAEFAAKGYKTLLVDGDPQANLTTGLGFRDPATTKIGLYDALMGLIDYIPTLQYNENLYLVPSNIDLSAAEMELVNVMMRETRLKSILEPIKDQYDFIVIDCAPTLSILTINALSAADYVFVPVETEYYALSGLDKLLNLRQMIEDRVNPQLRLGGIILTRHDSRVVLHRDIVEDIRKVMPEGTVLDTIIRKNVSIGEAAARGLTIFDHAPESNGAIDYKNVTAEILERVL
jgi:chromosome partitioning protein